MSAGEPVLSGGTLVYDFSTGAGQAYGGALGYKQSPGVEWMMVAGGESP